MEANFFRFLAGELAAEFTGCRIDKVHGPADGVTVLTLHGSGRTTQLIFRPAKSAGLLFATANRPRNPFTAPARVMWLRKRLTGRRLLAARWDWPELRLAFRLSPREEPQAGQWLVFDVRQELTLADDFPVPPEPVWPSLADILDRADIWREHPQITPPLRRTLSALAQTAPDQAAHLLASLAFGEPSGFFLSAASPPLPWPSPPSPADPPERFATALEAARRFGERNLFTLLAREEEREGAAQAKQAKKRLDRQLALVDRDMERHRALSELSRPAEALQIALSTLPPAPGLSVLRLEHPAHGLMDVSLDPRLTPAENMARLFRQAAKGRRGLEHCVRRRAELLAGPLAPKSPLPATPASGTPMPAPAAPVILPRRCQGIAVAVFRSSDGFLLLRGKSSKANHELLTRAAGPHDYWLHVAGGPSAHVILRRDYPDQTVPERTLQEAAVLCALKSWRAADAKAEVLLARVKDVRAVKGAAQGSVAVDQVERTLLVNLDASLEERLCVLDARSAPPPSGR